MITERWRDVEQALSADTQILPIWNAWGSARNEVGVFCKFSSIYYIAKKKYLHIAHCIYSKISNCFVVPFFFFEVIFNLFLCLFKLI